VSGARVLSSGKCAVILEEREERIKEERAGGERYEKGRQRAKEEREGRSSEAAKKRQRKEQRVLNNKL